MHQTGLRNFSKAIALILSLIGSPAFAFQVPSSGNDNAEIKVGACTGSASQNEYSQGSGIGNVFVGLSTPSIYDNYVNPHYDGYTPGIPYSSANDITSLTPADIKNECGVADAVLTITGVATGSYADEDLIGFQLEGKDPDNGNAHTRWELAVSGVTNTQVIAKKNSIAPTVDSVAGMAGVPISPFNVLLNDTTDGAASTVTNSILSVVTPVAEPGVELDVATGLLTTTAALSAGSYSITYQLCNAAAPTLCAQATATVAIDAVPTPTPTPTPVPVDSPWALLLAGVALVCGFMRIRSKS